MADVDFHKAFKNSNLILQLYQILQNNHCTNVVPDKLQNCAEQLFAVETFVDELRLQATPILEISHKTGNVLSPNKQKKFSKSISTSKLNSSRRTPEAELRSKMCLFQSPMQQTKKEALNSRTSPHSGNVNSRKRITLLSPISPEVPNLKDEQSFPDIRTSVEKYATPKVPNESRRIRPVQVQSTSPLAGNILSDFLTPEVSGKDAVEDQRKFCRKANRRRKSGSTNLDSTPTTSPSNVSTVSPMRETASSIGELSLCSPDKSPRLCFIEPSRTSVSNRKILDAVADLYAKCFSSGFIRNPVVELYFLVQMVTARVLVEVTTKPSRGLFRSAHDCVYFATRSLLHLSEWLSLLDSCTLKSLKSISYISIFGAELFEKITEFAERKSNITRLRSSFMRGVSFEVQTDSRENFPSDRSFSVFRKQRDAFCDLHREWRHHRHHFETQATPFFERRVGALFQTPPNNDPSALAHLARFVDTQLIALCCGGLETDDEGNIREKALADFKNQCPERFRLLEDRFTTGQYAGPCPLPSFPGTLGFFYEFLQHATALHPYLKQRFTLKLLETEQTERASLIGFDEEDFETDVDKENQVRSALLTTLYQLKIRGLFLGMLDFFPYQGREKISDKVAEPLVQLRNLERPSIDVTQVLKMSISNGSTLYTLTWLVNYLAMADPLAPRLEYFKEVYQMLFGIHQNPVLRKVSHATFYIRVLLGWLFELTDVSLPSFSQYASLSFSNALSLVHPHLLATFDQQALYTLCPYVGELKTVLGEFLNATTARRGGDARLVAGSGTSEVRKITPVSATKATHSFKQLPSPHEQQDDSRRSDPFSAMAASSEGGATSALDAQLIEAFYFVHSRSLKKIVEFVGERVSSNAIRIIKAETITSLRVQLDDRIKDAEDKNNVAFRSLCTELESRLSGNAVATMNNVVGQQISALLQLLVSPDLAPSVLQMCAQLATSTALRRVKHWIRTNITPEYVQHEAKSRANALLKVQSQLEDTQCLPNRNKDRHQHEKATSVFCTITNLQTTIADLIACRKLFSDPTQLDDLVCELGRSVEFRMEWSPTAWKLTQQLIVDLIFVVAIRHPALIVDGVCRQVVDLVCRTNANDFVASIGVGGICPKYLRLLKIVGNDESRIAVETVISAFRTKS